MEIYLNEINDSFDEQAYLTQEQIMVLHKMDNDEKVVRKALVKAWTKILEKYAVPGVYIPSVEEVYQELLEVGVKVGVDAVVKEHWFVFGGMIEGKVRKKVEKGLEKFNLSGFIEDVRAVQNDPGLIQQLRDRIKHAVMEG